MHRIKFKKSNGFKVLMDSGASFTCCPKDEFIVDEDLLKKIKAEHKLSKITKLK